MSMLKRLFRNGLNEPSASWPASISGILSLTRKNVLHVGCGLPDPLKLPSDFFPTASWQEIRLDINPEVRPDIVASITDLSDIPGECLDAVYSSHNLEHLRAHEVPLALFEFLRVLKPSGFLLILLPDLQAIAAWVAEDKLEDAAYVSAAGPIAPIDMIFGFRPALAAGNDFMSHRTGFTSTSLQRQLSLAGFTDIEIHRLPDQFALQAIGFRSQPKLG